MVDRRDVELVMRVQDLSTAAFKTIKESVDQLTASLAGQLAEAKAGTIGMGELKATMTQLQAAAKGLADQAGLIATFNKITTAIDAANTKVAEATDKLTKHNATLKDGEDASQSWLNKQTKLETGVISANATLAKQVTALSSVKDRLAQAGIEVDDLAASERALIATATQVGQASTLLSAGMLNNARDTRLAREAMQAKTQADKDQAASAKEAANAEKQAAADAVEATAKQTAAAKQLAAARATTNPQFDPLAGKSRTAADAQRATGTLGLRPYELQNLGYQVNDVVTQLSSGTGLSQVAAQQGGQILQIFNKNLFDLIPVLARASPLIAAFGTAFLVLNRAASVNQSVKEFQSILDSTSDSLKYNAVDLTNTRIGIQQLGASWSDAGSIIKQAISASIRPDALKQFSQAAIDLAQTTGTKVPDAMKTLVDAFTGGYQSILKLNDAYDFLTPKQAEQIKDLYDTGQQANATGLAFDAMAEKQHTAADEGMGYWSKVARDAAVVYHNLLDYIGDIGPIKVAASAWQALGSGIDSVLKVVGSALASTPVSALQARLSVAQKTLDNLPSLAQEQNGGLALQPSELAALQSRQQGIVADLQKQLADEQAKAAANRTGGGLFQASNKTIINSQAAIDDLKDQIAATHGLTDAETVRLAGVKALTDAYAKRGTLTDAAAANIKSTAEAEAQRIIQERDYLKAIQDGTGAIKDRNAAGEKAKQAAAAAGLSVQGQQQAADAAREQERARIAENDKTIADADEQHLRRVKDGVNATAVAAAGEVAYNKAVKEGILTEEDRLAARRRGEDEERARLAQAKSAASKANSEQNTRDSDERALQNQIGTLSSAGGNKGLVTLQTQLDDIDTKFQSLSRNIAKYQKAGGTSVGGQSISQFQDTAQSAADRAKALTSVTYEEGEINRIIQERNSLVQTYGALVETGSISEGEAQANIKKAYAETNPLIQDATDKLQAFIDTAKATGSLSGSQFDLLTAKISQFRAQAVYIDPLTANIEKNLKGSVSSSIVQGIDGIATALGGLVTGATKVSDVFTAMGTAVLGVLKSITSAILNAVVQFYTTQALTSAAAGGGGFLGAIGSFLGFGSAAAAGAAGAGGAAADVAGAAGGAAKFFHTGGVVGQGGVSKPGFASSLWDSAPRYHAGTGPIGLSPDEQAAVLQKGEEVLSKSNPRNILNGGGGVGGPSSIRNVLVFNDADIAGAMAGPQGEQVVINHLKRNTPAIRALLSGR
jgi:Prophage tail length tape measure protein